MPRSYVIYVYIKVKCWIWYSHCVCYEDLYLLGYNAMQSNVSQPMLWNNISWLSPYHVVFSQKTELFRLRCIPAYFSGDLLHTFHTDFVPQHSTLHNVAWWLKAGIEELFSFLKNKEYSLCTINKPRHINGIITQVTIGAVFLSFFLSAESMHFVLTIITFVSLAGVLIYTATIICCQSEKAMLNTLTSLTVPKTVASVIYKTFFFAQYILLFPWIEKIMFCIVGISSITICTGKEVISSEQNSQSLLSYCTDFLMYESITIINITIILFYFCNDLIT
jgi:hypothetical protein